MNSVLRNSTIRTSISGRRKLPRYIWVISISTIIACIGGTAIMGYQVESLGWLIPLFFAPLVLMRKRGPVRFPVGIWIPWICVVVGYLIVARAPHSLQRSVMMLCPFITGMTVSTLTIGENELENFTKLYRYMAVALYVTVLFKTGMLVTGTLPTATGLAAEVMTGALLCTLFAANYVYGKRREFVWWAALAVIPVIGLTRAGILASGLTLPLTFAPMKVIKRLFFVILVVAAGYGVFYTERVQHKMFYSGSGTIEDVRLENPDLSTSGRSYLWKKMQNEIDKMPLLGHGANASEPFVIIHTGGSLTHPHNDWLRLLFDYGYFGTVIFALCLLFQLVHALKRGRRTSGKTRVLFYAGASSLLIFVLFMFSDNIILYVAFFGNMQFTVLGLAYAAYGTPVREEAQATGSKRPLFRRISC